MPNFKSDLKDLKTRRLQKAATAPTDNPNDPIPQTLLVVEHRDALEHLRLGTRQEFEPDNPFSDALVDQIAEDIWTRQRLSSIHHQGLSIEIEQNHDALIALYPNADAIMHTIEAWKKSQADPTFRLAFTDQNPLTNRTLAVARYLDSRPRRRAKR